MFLAKWSAVCAASITCGGAGAVLRIRAQADADGEAQFRPLGGEKDPRGDVLAQTFRYLQAALLEGVGQEKSELVAAEAGHQVDLAQLGAESTGQFEEDAVPGTVPVMVVDGVEAVQVDASSAGRCRRTDRRARTRAPSRSWKARWLATRVRASMPAVSAMWVRSRLALPVLGVRTQEEKDGGGEEEHLCDPGDRVR